MKTIQLRLLPIALASLALMASCTEKNDLDFYPTKGAINQNQLTYNTAPQKIEKWTSYTYEFNSDRWQNRIYLIAYGMIGSIGEVNYWEFDWAGDQLRSIEYNDQWERKFYKFTYGDFSTFSFKEYDYNDIEGFEEQFCWTGKNNAEIITRYDVPEETYVNKKITFNDNNQIISISDNWNTYTLTWTDGNVTAITQENGKTWQYTYDNYPSSFAAIDGLLLVDIMEITQLPRFLSKNNVTSVQSNQSFDNYGYKYNGDYPKSASLKNTTDYFKYIDTPDPAPRLYHVSSNTSGAGYYPLGALVTLDASFYSYDPSDVHFDSWSNGSTNSILTFTVTGDTSFTAYYARGWVR